MYLLILLLLSFFSGIEVNERLQGSLIFVLSVKDKKGYDELLDLCQTGEIVDLVLDDNEKQEFVKSGKENLFHLSLCETEDGKSGKQIIKIKKQFTTVLNIVFVEWPK